jgi:hypothetical protein
MAGLRTPGAQPHRKEDLISQQVKESRYDLGV